MRPPLSGGWHMKGLKWFLALSQVLLFIATGDPRQPEPQWMASPINRIDAPTAQGRRFADISSPGEGIPPRTLVREKPRQQT